MTQLTLLILHPSSCHVLIALLPVTCFITESCLRLEYCVTPSFALLCHSCSCSSDFFYVGQFNTLDNALMLYRNFQSHVPEETQMCSSQDILLTGAIGKVQ